MAAVHADHEITAPLRINGLDQAGVTTRDFDSQGDGGVFCGNGGNTSEVHAGLGGDLLGKDLGAIGGNVDEVMVKGFAEVDFAMAGVGAGDKGGSGTAEK